MAMIWGGWLYFNPDTGTELSENHPVRSGECFDAENVRPATREALRDELLSAWHGLAEQEREHDAQANRLAARVAELEEALVVARNDGHTQGGAP